MKIKRVEIKFPVADNSGTHDGESLPSGIDNRAQTFIVVSVKKF